MTLPLPPHTMFSLLKGMGEDAQRILAALQTIESLPAQLSNLLNLITEMSSFKEIVLRGLDYLAAENAALKAEIEKAGQASAELEAALAAAQQELSTFLAQEAEEDSSEAAEDAQEAADRLEILDRLSQLVPAPAPEPSPEPQELPVEPAVEAEPSTES